MNYSSFLIRKAMRVCEAAELGESATLLRELEGLTKQHCRICVNLAPNGMTPLLTAIKYNHLQIVKHLVETYGADVNGRGKVTIKKYVHSDITPIWYASQAGYANIVEYLLENKAEVNSLNTYGSTPLYAACFTGTVETVKLLLRKGANVDMPTVFGGTGLLAASGVGDKQIVEVLLNYGADVNKTDVDGRTALHTCSEGGELDVIKLLLTKYTPIKPDKHGITPHLAAAIGGHKDAVLYYIKCGLLSVMEQIEALQILGASIVAQNRILKNAVDLWKQAIQLSKENGIEVKHNTSQVKRLLGKREMRTTAELDMMEEREDTAEIRVQAALICDRILGLNLQSVVGSGRHSLLTSNLVWAAGMVYGLKYDIGRAYQLWHLAISSRSRNTDRLTEAMVEWMEKVVEITEIMRFDPKVFSVREINKIFDITIYELGREQRRLHNQTPTFREYITECEERLERLTLAAVKLMALICMYTCISNLVEENLVFEKKVQQLAKLDPKGPNGQTLLQLVSSSNTNQLGSPRVDLFPSLKCQSMLLRIEHPENF